MNPWICAEASTCHDGDLDKARRLVQLAKDCDANAVKFSWWSSAERVAERMHAPESLETLRRYQWPREWLPELSGLAHEAGLEFLCTVDCPEDIGVVAPYVDRFKIASWGARDVTFIRRHVAHDKPLIVSTGLCDGREVSPIRIWLGLRVWILQCVSAYPAPVDALNLGVIRQHGYDGFSDHSRDWTTGGLAVAAGAKVLEVHVRLKDTDRANPDYPVALSPFSFKLYVQFARQAWRAMGDGVKRCQEIERPNLKLRYV